MDGKEGEGEEEEGGVCFTCLGPILWLTLRADTENLFGVSSPQWLAEKKKKPFSAFINGVRSCAFQ